MNTTTYAIYDLTTGAGKWFMTSEPDHIDNSTPSGCGWIEIDHAPDGGWHVDLETLTLVEGAIDLRELTDVKADQWAAVKAARDATIYSSFTWDGSVFDSNENSQRQIQGAVQLAALAAQAGQTFSIGWTLQDNSTRTLSGSEMISLGLALGTFVQTNFARGVALRNQINASTSSAEAQSITWAA